MDLRNKIIFFMMILCSFSINAFGEDQLLGDDKGCGNNPGDIIFVLDESGSIYGPHFVKQLNFVINFISSFDIKPSVTHIGLIAFGDDPRVISALNGPQSNASLTKVLKGVNQRRGGTMTSDALDMMNYIFQTQGRKSVPSIGIVITDGESDDPIKTKESAITVKDNGVTVFAIGVGNKVKEEELMTIASEPANEYMFRADDYDSLEKIKSMLAWKACEVEIPTPLPIKTTTTTEKPTPPNIQGCEDSLMVDLVFGISDQAGVLESTQALNFVTSIASSAEIGSQSVQVGLLPKNCREIEEIRLNDNANLDSLLIDAERRKLTNIKPYTDVQLSYLSEIAYSQEKGGRPDAKKVAVMIINNKSADPEATLSIANELKKKVNIITIGVGKYINREEVKSIASNPNNAFFVPSFSRLHKLKHDVLSKLC